MDMHYCDIFTDCYHCPAPFCPYDKLEPDWWDYVEEYEEEEDGEEERGDE